ncbi:hypothetical protein M5Y66_09795 [Enterobacter vonholyi]|uniref:hypothetical protein n=1 Tax=Enterobacter vonholyi TaxID=2797505 RepID=UPI0020C00543|nr:hypothetical protein [Enterobacter vonholyi]MCL5634794.1 hypothetical protein [Enterobacter vonholyi]
MPKHIIKYDHRDGVKLPQYQVETWCGHQPGAFEWLFQDAQHAVLCIEHGGSQVPCKRCLKAIRDVIDREVK